MHEPGFDDDRPDLTHCPKCDVQLVHKKDYDICPNCGLSNEPKDTEAEEEEEW